MSEKLYYHDINLGNIGQIKNFRIHNIADATAENALAGDLNTSHDGVLIYRTDTDQLRYWDGAAFQPLAIEVEGDLKFRGFVDASIAIDDAGQPQTVEYISGYQYVVTTAGTFNAGLSGVTLQGNQELQVGDHIVFTSATEAYSIQRNDVYASETDEGNIRLATQAEVDAGTVADEAVTPATLQGKLDAQFYTKQYTTTMSLTGGGTADTVNHALNLVNKDAFTINVMDSSGSQISVDVDSTDVDNLTLTSLLPLTNIVVTVIGAATNA